MKFDQISTPKAEKPFKRKWSDREIETIKHLFLFKHMSYTDIAVRLNTSRNSISGIINRLNLKASNRIKVKTEPKKKTVVETVTRKEKPKPIVTAPPIAIPIKGIAPPGSVKLLSRRKHQCAYLIGYHICCGAKTVVRPDWNGTPRRTSWCEDHYAVVYGGRSDKRKSKSGTKSSFRILRTRR